MATHNEEMAAIWGQPATYAEYRINDRIHYTTEGQTRTGTIVWVCAPGIKAGQPLPMRYVVQPDSSEGYAEIVLPGKIVINEKPQQVEGPKSTSGLSEQALMELLAGLSLPLIISMDTDDNGQLYYIWQVGASTPERPWGFAIGTDRQFSGALKLALERAMKYIREEHFSE